MKTVCAVISCGQKIHAGKFCGKHYMKFKQHGNPHGGRPFSNGIPLLFCKAIAAAKWPENSPCLPWPFGKSGVGYGMVNEQGKRFGAHEYILSLVGGPKPPGKEACHSCNKRDCVNPSHLKWGTHAENMADRLIRGTDNRGEKCGSCKLKENQVRAIRDDTRTQLEIANEYGITQTAVSSIKLKKTWAWLG